MHYFDHVFPLQFPVRNMDSTTSNRGWLLNFITKSVSFHWIILSISAYHEQNLYQNTTSVPNPQEAFETEEWRSYYALALHEFQNDLATTTRAREVDNRQCWRTSLELLACIVQFLSLAVCDGGFDAPSLLSTFLLLIRLPNFLSFEKYLDRAVRS